MCFSCYIATQARHESIFVMGGIYSQDKWTNFKTFYSMQRHSSVKSVPNFRFTLFLLCSIFTWNKEHMISRSMFLLIFSWSEWNSESIKTKLSPSNMEETWGVLPSRLAKQYIFCRLLANYRKKHYKNFHSRVFLEIL